MMVRKRGQMTYTLLYSTNLFFHFRLSCQNLKLSTAKKKENSCCIRDSRIIHVWKLFRPSIFAFATEKESFGKPWKWTLGVTKQGSSNAIYLIPHYYLIMQLFFFHFISSINILKACIKCGRELERIYIFNNF